MAKKKKKRNSSTPAKLRAVKKSTGWIPAAAVRFVKQGGKTVVLVRKKRR